MDHVLWQSVEKCKPCTETILGVQVPRSDGNKKIMWAEIDVGAQGLQQHVMFELLRVSGPCDMQQEE